MSTYLSAMPLNDPIANSELFRQLTKRRSLKHPTAATFDASAWLAAAARLDPPTARDMHLVRAAIHFGREIGSLRQRIADYLVASHSRESGVRLLAAIANQQYIVLLQKVVRVSRRLARDSRTSHLELITQNLVRNGPGQRMTADDHVTHLVDALPHWLHHLWQIPPRTTALPIAEPFQVGMTAMSIASIERGLRDLWHTVLWEGYQLTAYEGGLVITPESRDIAEKWLIWHLRDSANMYTEIALDAGASTITGGKLPPVIPVLARTVIAIRRLNGQKRQFVVGRANGLSPSQRSHVTERDMLERLYTGLFLDEPLPAFGSMNLTCRELCLAWWVITDLGRLMMDEISYRQISDAAGLAKTALTVKVAELTDILTQSLGINQDRARKIVDLFTCDPSKTTILFAKSLWSTPLLPASGDRRHIVLAPLLVGSPVRRLEAWLELGGISDQRHVKGRGKPFEAHVRSRLAEELAANPALVDYAMLPHGLRRVGTSEEIDLLARIGRTMIIGEVKCLLAPVEPMDRFNYLNAIEEAAVQAKRKCDWVSANRATAAAQLGITDPSELGKLTLIPVVILNQGYGIGLDIDGVAVTDLHFLSLVLGSGEYQSDTRFERGGMRAAVVQMYSTQVEFESRLQDLLRRPPPLRRYADNIDWTTEPFPASDGRPFVIEVPRLQRMPIDPRSMVMMSEAGRSSVGPP